MNHDAAYVMRRTRVAYVDILGKTWMPPVMGSLRKELSDYDLKNIGEFTRENVEQWLTCHSGDFQQVVDFRATCGSIEIPWAHETNEYLYYGNDEE